MTLYEEFAFPLREHTRKPDARSAGSSTTTPSSWVWSTTSTNSPARCPAA